MENKTLAGKLFVSADSLLYDSFFLGKKILDSGFKPDFNRFELFCLLLHMIVNLQPGIQKVKLKQGECHTPGEVAVYGTRAEQGFLRKS